MLGKTEVPGIYKESEGILINKDNDALMKYKKKKQLFRQKDARINTLEEQVSNLADSMEEIKTLLRKLTKE